MKTQSKSTKDDGGNPSKLKATFAKFKTGTTKFKPYFPAILITLGLIIVFVAAILATFGPFEPLTKLQKFLDAESLDLSSNSQAKELNSSVLPLAIVAGVGVLLLLAGIIWLVTRIVVSKVALRRESLATGAPAKEKLSFSERVKALPKTALKFATIAKVSLGIGLIALLASSMFLFYSLADQKAQANSLKSASMMVNNAQDTYDEADSDLAYDLSRWYDAFSKWNDWQSRCSRDPDGYVWLSEFGFLSTNCKAANYYSYLWEQKQDTLQANMDSSQAKFDAAEQTLNTYTKFKAKAGTRYDATEKRVDAASSAMLWTGIASAVIAVVFVALYFLRRRNNGDESSAGKVKFTLPASKNIKCPMCSEKIKAEAKICKHCGSKIS